MTQPLQDKLDFKANELCHANLDLKNYCRGWVGGNLDVLIEIQSPGQTV